VVCGHGGRLHLDGPRLVLKTGWVKGAGFAGTAQVTHDTGVTAVMFDWDGVLLDSLGAAFNVYNKIFARLGTKLLTKNQYLELQSPNWYDFYIRIGLPQALWREVDSEWLRLYQEERPDLHGDALECLASLKRAGLKLALVSNGSRIRVEEELAKFSLRSYFEVVLFGEKKEELKPSPIMLQRALSAMGVGPERSVYVGDSPADIQAAKNAGVPSIAIARGPIQAERLRREDPDRVFRGLDAMTEFLLRRS
jgi:HAD superfamily hydrolase (TIGR01509 family)